MTTPRDPHAQLKIAHTPGHAPDVTMDTVRVAELLGADSYSPSEWYRVADKVRDRPKYEGIVGFSKTNTRAVVSPRGDAGDNPVCIKKQHEILHRVSRVVDKPGTPAKFAPERSLKRGDYRWNQLVVSHTSIHPSPTFVGIEKWRHVMEEMVKEVEDAQADGHLVVVTGDLQSPILPAPYFKRLGLKTWSTGVDWIAYDRRLGLLGQVTQHVAGMDHPWMTATFVLVNL